MDNSLKNIAIMGCSGSGKTTITNIIRSKGYFTIDCDKIYKYMLYDNNVINKINQIVPNIYSDKNSVNFKDIGLFFEHNKSKEMEFEQWRQQCFYDKLHHILNNIHHLVFVDLPIFQNGYILDDFDYILHVKSQQRLCKQRIEKRNGYSLNKINYLIKRSSIQIKGKSVIVIENNESFIDLNDKVQLILQAIAVRQ